MKRLRVSILGLIAIVVVLAMAFAALRTASNLWFSALYTFTTVVLLLAVIAARFGHRSTRAFWFGFAVFGWGFLVLGSGAWLNPYGSDSEEGIGRNINPELLTSDLIFYLLPRLRKETNDLGEINRITANTIGIAHLLITLALALFGGSVAAFMRSRRGRAKSGRSGTIVASSVILAGLAFGLAASSGHPTRPPKPSFPAGAMHEPEGISRSDAEWYSKHLTAMDEAPLWRDRDATVYRLLWLPSFDNPVCVRIDRTAEGARLHARVLDGKGGSEPGQVAIDRWLTLDDGRWRELERLLEAASFWDLPTKPKDHGGFDGDQLIVEGVQGSRYHVVERWMPDPAYARLCRYMLDLTGMNVEKAWDRYH